MKLILLVIIFFYTVIAIQPSQIDGDCDYTLRVNNGTPKLDTIKFSAKCVWDVGDTFTMPSDTGFIIEN